MENNKNTMGIVVAVLALIILGLVGFIVYDKVIKNNENEITNNGEINNNDSNSDSDKRVDLKNKNMGYVYFEDFKLGYKLNEYDCDKCSSEDYNNYYKFKENTNLNSEVIYEKAIVNINSEDAEKINNKINDMLEVSKEEFKKSLSDKNNSCSPGIRIIDLDNKMYNLGKLRDISYKVEETEDYLTILFGTYDYHFCSQLSYMDEYVYTISKKTGKIYTEEEILGNNLTKEEVLKGVMSSNNLDWIKYNNLIDKTKFYLDKDGNIGILTFNTHGTIKYTYKK